MGNLRFFLLLGMLIGVTLLANAFVEARVELRDAEGNKVGNATITQHGEGIRIKLKLQGVQPGEHAIHIHQNAKCDPPDFKSAGPHFNPEGKKHGLNNPEGHHAGDMDNFLVQHTGKAHVTVDNSSVSLGKGANSVFANGGTALVIHAKPDDMKSDPAGNAGDRVACGLIVKAE